MGSILFIECCFFCIWAIFALLLQSITIGCCFRHSDQQRDLSCLVLSGNYYRPQRSCGKVMLLHPCVILFTRGQGSLSTGVSVGVGVGRSDNQGDAPRAETCGRYASYWNAFSLLILITKWASTATILFYQIVLVRTSSTCTESEVGASVGIGVAVGVGVIRTWSWAKSSFSSPASWWWWYASPSISSTWRRVSACCSLLSPNLHVKHWKILTQSKLTRKTFKYLTLILFSPKYNILEPLIYTLLNGHFPIFSKIFINFNSI